MLWLKPGSIMGESVLPLELWPMASLALSISVTELLEELNTRVDRLFGNSTIKPGRSLKLEREMEEGETRSSVASTIFRTGEAVVPNGARGFETKARNVSPLRFAGLFE
jgi:hypothetical protein